MRASTQARGTPSTSDRPVAHSEQMSDSFSASTATGLVRSVHRVDHEALVNNPIKGTARKTTVTVATATTGSGGRRPRVGWATVSRPQWAGRKLAACSTF